VNYITRTKKVKLLAKHLLLSGSATDLIVLHLVTVLAGGNDTKVILNLLLLEVLLGQVLKISLGDDTINDRDG
jgi:NAD/NADP transhydrogenase beta subunit